MLFRPVFTLARRCLVFAFVALSVSCNSEVGGPILQVVVEYDSEARLERLEVSGRFSDGSTAFAPGFVPQSPTVLTSGSETVNVLLPESSVGRGLLLRVDGERDGELAATGFAEVAAIEEEVTSVTVVLTPQVVECGDGTVSEPLEECDDGNINDDDGCSNECAVEADYVCETLPSGLSQCTLENGATDEPSIALTEATTTVEEGTGLSVEVTLRLPAGMDSLTESITSGVSFGGTATAGDFTAPEPLTIQFNSGATDGDTQTFTIAITADGLVEGNETLTVSLTEPDAGELGAINTLDATLNDGESSTVGFESVVPRAGEDDGTAPLRIVLTPVPITAALARDVSVTVSDRETGTAIPGTDYEAFAPTVVTFPMGTAGESVQSVPVTLIGDSTVESEKTVDFGLSPPAGPATLGANAATLTVVDDDSVAVSFAAETFTVDEDGGSVSIQVELNVPGGGVLPQDASVLVELLPGTAALGTDFQLPSAATRSLTFPAASDDGTQQSVQIAVADDALYEGTEAFTVRLALPSNAVIGVRGEATIEIVDDETAGYSFVEAASNVDEDAGPLTVSVGLVLEPGVSLAAPLAFRLADSGRGSATASTDYEVLGTGNQSFPAGSLNGARVDTTITPIDNDVVDGSRTVVLELSGPLGIDPVEHVATLVDDENASISFVAPNQRVSEDAGTVAVGVVLNVPGGGGLLAPAEIVLEVTSATTASDTLDFTTDVLTLNFDIGALDGAVESVELSIVDDVLVEADEVVVFGVASASGVTAGSGTASVGIDDNETATVGFALTASSIAESSGSALDVEVTLDLGPADGTRTTEPVVVTVSDTLEGNADPGTDYTFISPQTLTFPAGSADGATQVVSVTPIDDAILEGAKTVVLRASATGAALGTEDHTVTFSEDDSATLEFSSSIITVSEDDGSVTVSVVLSVPGGGVLIDPVSAEVRVAAGGSALGSGTDFTEPVDAEVSFGEGSASGESQSVTFALVDDSLFEGDEVFMLQLSALMNGLAGATDTLTVTLEDDETGTVGFATDSSFAAESDGAQSIDIVLSLDSLSTTLASDVTVNVTVAAGSTAVDGVDFTITSELDFTVPAGSGDGDTVQVVIEPIDDADVGSSVQLVLALSATGAPLSEAGHTLALTDDDTASVSLASSSLSVGESGSPTLDIELSIPSGGTLTTAASVDVSLIDETTSSSDYTGETSWTVSFPVGFGDGDTDSVSVTLVNDRLYEGDETFRIELSNPSGISLGATTSQRVTIVDDESALVGFRLASSNIAEDDSDSLDVDFFLTLDAESTAIPIDVTVADTGTGTAQSAVDFSIVGGLARTFPIGSVDDAEESIEIAPIDDAILQGDLTIILSLSSSDASASVATHEATLVEDETATVSFNPTSLSVNEDAGTVQATLELSVPAAGNLPSAVSVQVVLSAGSATALDFSFTSPQTVNFSANDGDGTTATVDITVVDDGTVEVDETVVLQLSSPSSGLMVGTDNEFTLTITDDD